MKGLPLGHIHFGITHKLLIFFLLFVVIFYGTLLVLFTNTQKMMALSQEIVSKNIEVDSLGKVLHESLLNMQANDKKYRLLGKTLYLDYFHEDQRIFEESLGKLLALESAGYELATGWKELAQSYESHMQAIDNADENTAAGERNWVEESRIIGWLGTIAQARQHNEREIGNALLAISNRGKESVGHGLIGMGITVVVGLLGAFFLSKSILQPLGEFKHALRNFSSEYSEEIQLERQDEFGELATAFNDMSRQLKEEEELRSEFISTLSHEIRTPLSSIRESVNMILEGVMGPINDKQAKFLEIAQAEINRISDLLNHLLQVSRLDSQSREVTPVLIDPNKLVLEVSRGLVPSAKARGVTMRLHKMADPPVVVGVKKELQQVLFNLLENAIKFSPRGGKIEIGLFQHKDMLVYRVSDQGPGIPDKEQTLIFSKYYRTKNARNHTDGVGLGLSISKRIIQFHGGGIYVKNNKERGCSFYCSLPCEMNAKAA